MRSISDPLAVKIIIAGPDLRPVLPTVTDWTSIDCTVKLNEAGTGTFVAPARADLIEAVSTPGNRVHLSLNGQVWIAGPIEVPGALDWSGIEGGTVSVTWASDIALLGWRRCYPDPSLASTAQGSTLRYTASGTAEVMMRDLVNLNAGPGALTERQIQGLVLGELAGVGSSVQVSTRFDPLSDQVRTLAAAGGSLTFDVLLRDNATTGDPELAFLVWAPRDLSSQVVYSAGLGNLRSVKTRPASPTATVAIVGYDASGDTPDTTVVERVGGQSWGRIETWVPGSVVDSGTTQAEKEAQMSQDGDLALLDGKESSGVDADVTDTDATRYGQAYQLGDTLGTRPVAGTLVADVVTAVKLSGTPEEGLVEAPVIGTGNPAVGSARVRAIRDMERRLGRQERG